MDYRERIDAKVGMLFQIADQYLGGQASLDEAKDLISGEMANIRPAQFESMKTELGERLKKAGNKTKSEKIFELFRNYLSPPYNKLQTGHPLRNYYEENSIVRSVLLKIDEMEGQEAATEDWKELYEALSGFPLHIKRLEKNFYPLLIPMGMRLQVEKVKDLGSIICTEILKNLEYLKNGDIIEFLFQQRNLSQSLMNYLDLEERVLYAKALISLTDQDFAELRSSDDKAGYVFIEQPADFVPKEKKNHLAGTEDNNNQTRRRSDGAAAAGADQGMILSALLAAKDLSVIYYTLSGEVISVIGDQIEESDLQMAEETRQALLDGREKQRKHQYTQGNQTFLITCSPVMDSLGICQGLLKIKENISERKEYTNEWVEEQKKENRGIDSTQNIVELFRMYPKFQEDFFRLDEELEGLKGPFGMNFLQDSTVEMVAKSLRIDASELVDRINILLKSY